MALRLNIVVALGCEARPLRQRLELEPVGDGRPFRLYRRDDAQLVVSGVGAAAAASAVTYLAGREPENAGVCWLNVGVAGHRSLPLGAALLAQTVIEARSGQRWDLSLPSGCACPTATICTVDTPEVQYRRDYAYEMEAAGFVAAARRVASAPRVQCLKVVSDNDRRPMAQLTAKGVTALIEQQLGAIVELAALMSGLPFGIQADCGGAAKRL